MRHPSHIHSMTNREKQELLDEVAQVEKLAASIRDRMRRLHGDKSDSVVTSITARLRRLEMPDPGDDEAT